MAAKKTTKKKSSYKNRTALTKENRELKARLKELEAGVGVTQAVELQSVKTGPMEAAPVVRRESRIEDDGREVAVFKSPYPGFKQRITPAMYVMMGINGYRIEGLKFVDFAPYGVAVVRDADEIKLMRGILADMRERGRRPHFIEVTAGEDIDILSFRERVPPSDPIEFRGPLIQLPAIHPPPPPEASETMDTLEGRRAIPAATKRKPRPIPVRRYSVEM